MAKRKPNKAEREYMGKVAEMGCRICQRPAEVHHIRTGQGAKRASHYDVIPLCPDHHRNGNHGVAIHRGVKTWEANFGTELSHLTEVQQAMGVIGEL